MTKRQGPAMTKVCVFAGAGGDPALVRDAYTIGYNLAEAGCHVYYGGSKRGVMGGLAQGMVDYDRVYGPDGVPALTGVLPESIAKLKHYDPAIDLVVTPDMPSRKAVFWQCDAFLCLPGGFGTLDELSEILTEMKLGHQKVRPVVIYSPAGFYDPLKKLFDNMVWHGLMTAERKSLVQFVTSPMDAVVLVTAGAVAETVLSKEE